MNEQEDLVERVRSARRARGLTQVQVAERAGISPRTYQNFENRVGSPQGGNLRAILKAVDIDASDEETAESTRESWPPDLRVILDTLGVFLATMSSEERADWAHDEIRRIIESRGNRL